MMMASIILALTIMTSQSPYTSTNSLGSKAPPVIEVQRRAIEQARLDPQEITQWKKKARYAALLPKFQIDYARRMKYDVNVSVADSVYVGSGGSSIGPSDGAYAQNNNSDQNIEIKAVWNFSEAIFNPELLAVSEETRLLARERHSLLAEVNKNYFEREKFAGEIKVLEEKSKKCPKSKDIKQEIFLKRISLDESTAALDAMTGGWFSEEIKKMEGGGEK